MSTNSEMQDDIITRLEETVPGSAFVLLHWGSNIGENGELYVGGQTGYSKSEDEISIQMKLLGIHMLLLAREY